ncbi:DUF4265 domain-containing protein [Algoriella sp.]|uniref:DUF4265 domain-containing protein n=1 Tax=Algoriella sp. TaxID=1872434 RepID=UPI002FCB3065
MNQETKYEKILVRYYSNVLEEVVVETLWAETINKEKGLYKVDNIPFYGANFSSDDIVFAEYDRNEERLTFRKVIEFSGNSTIQVIIINNKVNINEIRAIFNNLECISEALNDKYFVIEIPTKINYKPIFIKLIDLEEKKIISFAEPVLSEKHNNDKTALNKN